MTPDGIRELIMPFNTSLNIYRTTVNLKELSPDGESVHYSKASGELKAKLADLVGSHDYTVDITLNPMGNVFAISGQITTKLDVQCARCGRELTTPIAANFNEIIIVLNERPRAGHSGHTGSSEEGPFCNYVTSHTVDLAEFVHEHIAAAEPYRALCDRSDCETVYEKAQVTGSLRSADMNAEANPFAVLKELSKRD
jgi:uncharacterized metal-binding protein YceD (DUF177 family)